MLKNLIPALVLITLLALFPELGYFIVLLLVLIFVHELGHFLAAKLSGVRVETFSLGFPPKAWSRTVGETEYQLAWLPLGGYVKMYGDDPSASGSVPPELESRSYSHQKPRVKILIALAGPAFNLLFAALLFWGLIWVMGIKHLSPVLGPVAPGSPAFEAGLRPDDRLLAVNGRPAQYFDALDTALTEGGGAPLELTIGRAGTPDRTVTLAPTRRETRDLFGDFRTVYEVGVSHRMKPVVERAAPGSPAAAAGLAGGDLILAIDGRPTPDWDDVLNAIQGPRESRGSTRRPAEPLRPLTLTVSRDGQTLSLTLTPKITTGLNQDGEVTYTPLVGIEARPEILTEPVGFGRAAVLGALETANMIGLTLKSVQKLVTGQVSAKTLGGPILIAEVTGDRAKAGLEPLLNLAAFISINLGILNLLPVPILDGGQIFFFLIEALRRRQLSLRFREIAQWVGVVCLGLLMLLVFYNDIDRLITRFYPPAQVEAPAAPAEGR
ncbi:MAG: RIP metalloprotease RseP [Candidatus Adiutrix sp.]|jgi:regulator of sigma E protease|nr:RIP metalloprotease RseP [Candidatus Adiutrix sp.]